MSRPGNPDLAINHLRRIYSERRTESALSFKQWLRVVQARAEQMYGIKPANARQILAAITSRVK
jgi:hypothetical protein